MNNNPNIEKDLFSGDITIDWEYVANRIPPRYGFSFEDAIVTGANNTNFSKLIFSPVYRDRKHLLKIRLQDKFFKPKKGDSITFLFENNEFLIFIIDQKPIEIMNHENWGKILETLILISENQLAKFSKIPFKSWKFKSNNNEIIFKDGVAVDQFRPLFNLQKSITSLFSDYLKIIRNENIKFKPRESLKEAFETCYVYLMKDNSNGIFKIGISNKPEYREKTLQSEKPTIEMVHTKRYPTRKTAEVMEKVLHEVYANKRVRGEWFELDHDDIADLIVTLT